MAGSHEIQFQGADGGWLSARLDRPHGEPLASVLFAHCFDCADAFAATRISGALADRGFAVMRFESGRANAPGEAFPGMVADLAAAANYMRAEAGAPRLLVGHSLGGTAILAAAPAIPEALAVATINAPCDQTRGIDEQDLLTTVRRLRKALLLFHAPRDQIVGINDAARLFQAAMHPKSFVSLDDADHQLSRHEDATYVAEVIAAWASRYLEPASRAADSLLEPGTVVVEESGAGPFGQTVKVGRHVLQADEPVAYGGKDTGPGPYDYLLAALGACTSMTIRMYAERKEIPLQRIAVRLRHEKIHAQDCADCRTKEGKIDRIEREIDIEGDLDEETRSRLLEIADKCPVHRTLSGEVSIQTKLRDQ